MAFVSSGYNPDKPMENRITDIGPKKYDQFYPPVIAKNKGKWLYHEYLKPGVLVHVAESGDECYTVRCGGARLMSVTHIREICEIADKHCDGRDGDEYCLQHALPPMDVALHADCASFLTNSLREGRRYWLLPTFVAFAARQGSRPGGCI